MFTLTAALPHCPFPHWPTDSKETFVKFRSGWTVPQVKTTQWLLAQVICSSYHTFSLVPFCPTVSHSPCCGDTGSTKHAILCYVLFFLLAACSAWNARFCLLFTILLCTSSFKKCFWLSQAELITTALCYHVALFRRPVSQPLLPVRLWITSILFILCSLARHYSKFCRHCRKQNKIPTLMDLFLPKGDRQ